MTWEKIKLIPQQQDQLFENTYKFIFKKIIKIFYYSSVFKIFLNDSHINKLKIQKQEHKCFHFQTFIIIALLYKVINQNILNV